MRTKKKRKKGIKERKKIESGPETERKKEIGKRNVTEKDGEKKFNKCFTQNSSSAELISLRRQMKRVTRKSIHKNFISGFTVILPSFLSLSVFG